MTSTINSFHIFFYLISLYFLLRIIFMKYLFLNVMSSSWKIYVLIYSSQLISFVFALII